MELTKDQIQARAAELAAQALSVDEADARGLTFARDERAQFIDSLPENQKEFARGAFADAYTVGLQQVIPDASNSQINQLKTFAKAELFKSGVGAAAGVAQVIDGAFRNSRLQRPELPRGFQVNDQVRTRITQSIARENDGNADLQRLFDSRLAERNFVGNQIARATSGGDPSRFSANAQANNFRTATANRGLLELFDNLERRDRQETNSLIGELRTQEQLEANDDRRNFSAEEQRFNQDQARIGGQINSGFDNLFSSAGGVIDGLTALRAVNQQVAANRSAAEESNTSRSFTIPTVAPGTDSAAQSLTGAPVVNDGILNGLFNNVNGTQPNNDIFRNIVGQPGNENIDIGLSLLDRSVGPNFNDLSNLF